MRCQAPEVLRTIFGLIDEDAIRGTGRKPTSIYVSYVDWRLLWDPISEVLRGDVLRQKLLQTKLGHQRVQLRVLQMTRLFRRRA